MNGLAMKTDLIRVSRQCLELEGGCHLQVYIFIGYECYRYALCWTICVVAGAVLLHADFQLSKLMFRVVATMTPIGGDVLLAAGRSTY